LTLFEKRNEKAAETRKVNDEIKTLKEQLAQALPCLLDKELLFDLAV
jgi:hypothetical protein